MNKKVLYLVRHGQENRNGVFAKETGGGLTEMGRFQAASIANRLKNLPISVIHHSTLPRAVETAMIIQQSISKIPLIPSDVLKECLFCIPPAFADEFEAIGQVELDLGLDQCKQAFYTYFQAKPFQASHEIVVCHGNIIRYFVCRALQIPLENYAFLELYNCGLCEVWIFENGRVHVVSYNDSGHLSGEFLTFG